MLVDVLGGNDYEPVIVEDLEITKVEHASPCKKRKLDLIDGNECEPFDSNFSNDSHLLISHSVLITPEDNPQGNQEKQLKADCQEQPTAKTTNKASQTVKMEMLVLWKYLIKVKSSLMNLT